MQSKSEYKKNLEAQLWKIADELRGKMDANEYKNYILGFIFYKYLCQKLEMFMDESLKVDGKTFKEAYKEEKYKKSLESYATKNLGYFLTPNCLFTNIVNDAKNKKFIIENIQKAMKKIEESAVGEESADDFVNLFEDVDLNSSRLGKDEEERNSLISKILLHLDEINFQFDDDSADILGDAYEYLISQFASEAGKKAGEFYTPKEVSTILAKIVTLGKDEIKSVYDATCGSGSLLLRVGKEAKTVVDYYGQELNQTTYNLARMNMTLHGIGFQDFDIQHGDSLTDPKHLSIRDEGGFEAIVANPPFSANWSADEEFLKDDRFSIYGKLPPKSKADYAFIEHMIYLLGENDATMAIVLPHGVLFRGASEGIIRKFMIETKNYLDAVIGLPANVFYGTSIPTVILVFKKDRDKNDNILFIDASKNFEKVKNQNFIRDEDIDKIITTYENRQEIEKFSHIATMDEIIENEYNLNIPRYVDTFEEEEPIDLDKVVDEIIKLNKESQEIDKKIKKYCDELGIRTPF
ncbi:MAG: type I restriction-modification system subunit M [Methanobrevibacter sp.]|jgi:type I restriction enzyme M protein|nr:type I restriction-modification system subunit M [Candidatus Methanoflexus mossambicus]